MSASTIQDTQKSLTATDRCDRCGAQAYLLVVLLSGLDLLFCAHHAREHGPKLETMTAYVHDETHKLEPKPGDPGVSLDA